MPPHNQQKINILTILVAEVAEENEKHRYAHAREKELSIPISKEHCNITTQSIVLISRQALRLFHNRH